MLVSSKMGESDIYFVQIISVSLQVEQFLAWLSSIHINLLLTVIWLFGNIGSVHDCQILAECFNPYFVDIKGLEAPSSIATYSSSLLIF